MDDVLKLTDNLRQKAHDYGEELSAALGVAPQEPPVGVFGMIFNKHTIALELLSHYQAAWRRATTTQCNSVAEARQENAERVISIQRMVFTESMSSVEYCAKCYVLANPGKIGQFAGRVYLRAIMQRSRDHHVISSAEYELWEGVIELRNAAVHNNAISEVAKQYNYPQCILLLRQGSMVRGNLRVFPQITDWLLDSCRSWILEMAKR